MKKEQVKYPCKACNRLKAVLRKIFITSTLKFRCSFHCPICLNNFEMTVNGKNWKEYNYCSEEIKEKIKRIIDALVVEEKIIIRNNKETSPSLKQATEMQRKENWIMQ